MRNVAAVLLLVTLGVGYFLFVHNKNFDPSIIPGFSDFSESFKSKSKQFADDISAAATKAKDDVEDKIEFKYGGDASKSKPQEKSGSQKRREEEHEEEEEGSTSVPHGQEHRRHDDEEEGDEEEDQCIPSFTRDYIMDCEGYYRSAEDADEDLPWPRPNKNNWPCPDHKKRWIAKLKKIQEVSTVKTISDPVLAQSRLEKKVLSNKLFLSRDKNKEGHPICWTQDLLNYYIDKFDVVPSEEFYYWVLDFEM